MFDFEVTNLEVKDYDNEDSTKLLSTDNSTPKKLQKWGFRYNGCKLNPDYEKGLRYLPNSNPAFDSCLIGSNDTQSTPSKRRQIVIKTEPKWITSLAYSEVDTETGEIVGRGTHITNEFKKSNSKKIASMDAFASRYDGPYKAGRISLLFHTLTRPNHARMSFRRMLAQIIKRYKALGFRVNGYVWTAEVTDRQMWHYHLVIALDKRMNVKGGKLPDKILKLEELWGQRTHVQFVMKNVRHYMAKYFAKHNARPLKYRSYGRSRKFI